MKSFADRVATAATLAAVLAGALVMTGLGGSGPSQTSPSVDLQVSAHSVFDEFNGTVEQRDAGALLQAYALNRGMDACMAEHGYPEWDWSAARNYAPPVDPLGVSTFFAEPMGSPLSDTAMATRGRMVAEEALLADNPTGPEADVVRECVVSTPAVSDDDADAAGRPTGVPALREAWWAMLWALDAQYGDEAAYGACLARADLSLLPGTDSAEDVEEALNTLVPPSTDIPTAGSGARPTAAWSRLVAAESQAAQADWTCREQTYLRHQKDVADAIAAFAQENADAIEAARAGWAGITARVAKIGGPEG